jgi:hypothetical protein
VANCPPLSLISTATFISLRSNGRGVSVSHPPHPHPQVCLHLFCVSLSPDGGDLHKEYTMLTLQLRNGSGIFGICLISSLNVGCRVQMPLGCCRPFRSGRFWWSWRNKPHAHADGPSISQTCLDSICSGGANRRIAHFSFETRIRVLGAPKNSSRLLSTSRLGAQAASRVVALYIVHIYTLPVPSTSPFLAPLKSTPPAHKDPSRISHSAGKKKKKIRTGKNPQ